MCIAERPDAANDIEALVHRARAETNPHRRAQLWGEAIGHVLSLNDIREGLTFAEIARMPEAEADRLADHMCAVFELREPWGTWNRDPDPHRLAKAWGTIRDGCARRDGGGGG